METLISVGNSHQCQTIEFTSSRFPSDDGEFVQHTYDSFMRLDLTGYRFANFKTVRTVDTIKFHVSLWDTVPSYACEPTCPQWDDINCDDDLFPIKTQCRDRNGHPMVDPMRKRKMFIHGVRNFFEYVQKIQNKSICMHEFQHVWRRIYEVLLEFPHFTIINHNLDVDTLHFKWVRWLQL
jgi:hypothetical protein